MWGPALLTLLTVAVVSIIIISSITIIIMIMCLLGTGIFLKVKECKIAMFSGRSKGCFMSPPYLDQYGETDQGLKRGNPLKLCQER